jgi:hypothetical protein
MFSANGEREGGKERKVRWALGAVRKDMKQRTQLQSWSTHNNIQVLFPFSSGRKGEEGSWWV